MLSLTVPDTNLLRVNGDRLRTDFDELAEIGATVAGGVSRLALSNEDLEARAWFANRIEDDGFVVAAFEEGLQLAQAGELRRLAHQVQRAAQQRVARVAVERVADFARQNDLPLAVARPADRLPGRGIGGEVDRPGVDRNRRCRRRALATESARSDNGAGGEWGAARGGPVGPGQ